jgi:putative phage-type endonuclease
VERLKGIGGTDIAAILGLNPWKSPMDVYLEKTGLVDGPEENEAMFWGKELEELVLRRYQRDTGHYLSHAPPMMHLIHPWYVGSPDALAKNGDGALGVVDAKTTGRRDDYGEPGTDEVPDIVACQMAWYCGLIDAQWADVAVLFLSPRRQFAIYHLPRNQEIIDNLIEAGREFWEGHVIPRIPPPLDASGGPKLYLNLTYPQDRGDIIPATIAGANYLSRLQAVKEIIAEAEKEKAVAEAHIKALIGDAQGILSREWKATWKKNKDSLVTDWEKAYTDLFFYAKDRGLNLNKDDFEGKHTTIKPGPRVLRVTAVKEGK